MPDRFDPKAVAPETARFNAQLETLLSTMPLPMDVPIPVTRAARAAGQGVFPPAGPRSDARWQEIPGVDGGSARVRLTEPAGSPRGTYLHVHGGGWTFNAPDQYDGPNRRVADETGARVVSVEYRLAPEHRWPACAEDCVAAARWALSAFDGPLVIGGESAGAHLTLATTLVLRDAGELDRVRGLVLSYGMYDLAGTPSARLWGRRFLVLSTPIVDWFVSNLTGGDTDRESLRRGALSPLWADLSGLPPALLQCGTADPLLDDTLFLHARLEAAGVRTERAIWPGGVHAFDQFDLPIAREANARQDAFVAACLDMP